MEVERARSAHDMSMARWALLFGNFVIGCGVMVVAGTLNDLALALFVGMQVGTYSSIFVATPILAQIKEGQPEIKALRKRVETKRASSGEPDGPVALGTSAIVAPSGPRQQRVRKPRAQR